MSMAQQRPPSEKITVRRTVVSLALRETLLALDPLDSQPNYGQQVFVASRMNVYMTRVMEALSYGLYSFASLVTGNWTQISF